MASPVSAHNQFVQISDELGIELAEFRAANEGLFTPAVDKIFNDCAEKSIVSRVTPSQVHAAYQMIMGHFGNQGADMLTSTDLVAENPSETMTMLARTLLSSALEPQEHHQVFEKFPLQRDNNKKKLVYNRADVVAGMCADAEPMFYGALARLDLSVTFPQSEFTGNIALFMDGDEPLFLKKFQFDENALALTPFFAGGIWYPAGTITTVDTIGDQEFQIEGADGEISFDEFGESNDPYVLYDVDEDLGNGSKVRVLDASTIRGVRALRLSAWANSDTETRCLYGYSFHRNIGIPDRSMIVSEPLGRFVSGIKTFIEECA